MKWSSYAVDALAAATPQARPSCTMTPWGDRAVASELPSSSYSPSLLEEGGEELRTCYFDCERLCPRQRRCQVDDRPCHANRDYFDHVYLQPRQHMVDLSSPPPSPAVSLESPLAQAIRLRTGNKPLPAGAPIVTRRPRHFLLVGLWNVVLDTARFVSRLLFSLLPIPVPPALPPQQTRRLDRH
eukprot:scaffold289_cov169-Ochromonas_danica.AAC.11